MEKAPYLTIDTEGTLNHPFSETWGLSYSALGTSEYFGFKHRFGSNLPLSWLPKLAKVIMNHPCLVFHHAKHDLRALRNLGIEYKGKFYDTMLMAHYIDENLRNYQLDNISRLLGTGYKDMPETAKKIKDAFGWDYIPVELMRSYADNDAVITELDFNKMLPVFQREGFVDPWSVDQDFVRVLMHMEDTGVLIDQDATRKELNRGLGIMKELRKELGFDPAKRDQLGKFLLDDLSLPVIKKTDKGKPCFDKNVLNVYDELLSQNNDKRARMLLIWRGWQKTTSSNYKPYLEKLHSDGRLRANYKMHGTTSGRLSCEDPNLQNIPKTSENDWNGNLKSVFIVEEGRKAHTIDYAQLELRLGLAYALKSGKVSEGELKLLEAVNDPTRDTFNEMGEILNMSRRNTKTLVYLMQYLGGEDIISEKFGVGKLASRAIKDNYYKTYPGFKNITDISTELAEKRGWVKNWPGRKRHFRYPKSEAYKAFSHVIQGGGFEIVKRGMIQGHKDGLVNDDCKLEIQIHDEIMLDIKIGKEDMYLKEWKRVLENVKLSFDTPVKFRTDSKEWGKK